MVCANKQNAAQSGTEQAADLTKTFKIMHHFQDKVSVTDTPIERHPLKRAIYKELQKEHEVRELILKPTKKNGIIDFCSCVPEMTSKAANRNNILHGFKENGMIDRQFLQYPDFHQMLSTCRRDPTKEEYQLCIDSFHFCIKFIWIKGTLATMNMKSLDFQ